MGMLVYVFDFGIVWVSRGQAQNAADAGALSGALARAFDDFDDPPVADGVADMSRAAGGAVQQRLDCRLLASTCRGPARPAWSGDCARADVYRNGEFASANLPVIFGPVLGITSHGVRATATAVVSVANSTNCMRPFSVADRWIHSAGATWTNTTTGRRTAAAAVELDPKDIYNPGTGWTIPGDIGVEQILKGGNNPNSDTDPINPGWMLPVRLPDGNGGYVSGGDDYRDAIGHCIGAPVTIGDYLPLENGVMNGPTNQGVDDLIALDPDATFNTTTKMVEDSCAPGCGPQSPRIVPIAVWTPTSSTAGSAAERLGRRAPAGGKCVKVVKILGYFVSHMSGGDVVGYLMTLPGEFVAGGGMPPGDSFLINIRLVR